MVKAVEKVSGQADRESYFGCLSWNKTGRFHKKSRERLEAFVFHVKIDREWKLSRFIFSCTWAGKKRRTYTSAFTYKVIPFLIRNLKTIHLYL